jgi:ribosome-associated translation inhibitor RaiA
MGELLDFTIEFNSEDLGEAAEAELFTEADNRLHKLAKGHSDLTGAAINIRRPAKTETGYIYEATVVAYIRPKNVAASEKRDNPRAALKGALSAVERQVRKRRAKLSQHWERPGNEPVEQEVLEAMAAEEEIEEEIEEEESDS